MAAMAAQSFSTTLGTPDALARALSATRASVSAPAGGLVFVSGALTQEVGRVAELVRGVWRNLPVAIVPAAGVITERGELEGTTAVAGLLWSGGRVTPFGTGEGSSPGALGEAVAAASPPPARAGTVLVFPRSDFAAEMLDGLAAAAPSACVLGAGTVGASAVALTASGEILRGRVAGLVLHGLSAPLVEASPACRLLSPLLPIEEVSNGMLLQLGDTPALDRLTALTAAMSELRGAAPGGAPPPPPVVFVALADAEGDRFVLRPVRGLDPARRGILVGPEARPGMRAAFAVRDAAAARAGLEATARGVAQQAIGSAPRFALFVSCAGRGQGLYGAPDVEARILRHRFGDLPIVGMHSAFELVPWGPGEARIALYTGVLALFRSPS